MNDRAAHWIGPWFFKEEPHDDLFLAFEAFGHAMANAAALEMQVLLIVLKAEALKLGKRSQNQRTPDELRIFADTERKKTMMRKIASLRKAFDISAELSDALKIANDSRDYLAHHFWDINLANLVNQRGIEIIANQCAVAVWHFVETSAALERELSVDVTDWVEMLSNDVDELQTKWSEFLASILA